MWQKMAVQWEMVVQDSGGSSHRGRQRWETSLEATFWRRRQRETLQKVISWVEMTLEAMSLGEQGEREMGDIVGGNSFGGNSQRYNRGDIAWGDNNEWRQQKTSWGNGRHLGGTNAEGLWETPKGEMAT